MFDGHRYRIPQSNSASSPSLEIQVRNFSVYFRLGFKHSESDHRHLENKSLDHGCGQVLLEGTDDYMLSESGITETSCFSETMLADGYRPLQATADVYPEEGSDKMEKR